MNKTYLTLLSGLLFLSACTGSAPANQDLATDSTQQTVVNEAQQSVSSDAAAQQVEEETEEVEPQEEIVLDKILPLLAKENIGGDDYKDAWTNAIHENKRFTCNGFQITVSESEGAYTFFDIGAFKNPDGSYLVVVFDNSGIDYYCIRKVWSYVFDGVKLTAKKIDLPKVRFADLLDPVCYFDVSNKKLLNRLKTGTLKEFYKFLYEEGKLCAYVYLDEEIYDLGPYEEDDAPIRHHSVRALYDWNGERFVYTPNQPKRVVDEYSIGNLVIGHKYQGEPIDGYDVKAEGTSYACWRNGEMWFRINMKDDRINSFDLFTDKLVFYGDGNVGDNLNKLFKNAEWVKNIEKNDSICTLVTSARDYYVKATDVVGVKNDGNSYQKITFKDGATVEHIRLHSGD